MILALVGTALFRLFSGALGNASAADDMSRAVLVAESVLAEAAAAQPLREATQQGTVDDGRIEWTTKVAPYSAPDVNPDTERGSESMPTAAFSGERRSRVSGGQSAASERSRSRRHASRRETSDEPRRAKRGFTLIELVIALVLMALIAAMMFGSLSMAARSWDGGEAKATDVSSMRQAQAFLREQIEAELPLRVKKAVELPLHVRRRARRNPLCRGAAAARRRRAALLLPARGRATRRQVAARAGAHDSRSGAQRRTPSSPTAEHSVLADGIAELAISYFGRDANAADVDTPSWRDRWDDKQRLPLLMRIDVKPVKGAAWPHARRRAAARARIRVRIVRPGAQPLRGDGLMRALRHSPAVRSEGIALIAVLWLTILLTVIASGFAYSMRGEALAARNAMSLAQARAAADGAVERTAFELLAPAQPARRVERRTAGRRPGTTATSS